MRLVLIDVRPAAIPDDLDALPVEEVVRLAARYVLTSRALLSLVLRLTGRPRPN